MRVCQIGNIHTQTHTPTHKRAHAHTHTRARTKVKIEWIPQAISKLVDTLETMAGPLLGAEGSSLPTVGVEEAKGEKILSSETTEGI